MKNRDALDALFHLLIYVNIYTIAGCSRCGWIVYYIQYTGMDKTGYSLVS